MMKIPATTYFDANTQTHIKVSDELSTLYIICCLDCSLYVATVVQA